MATLTIKNVPEQLVRQLKRQAAEHRRSLNQEVIRCLEKTIQAMPIDVDDALARVRAIRKTLPGGKVTDARLKRWISDGRL